MNQTPNVPFYRHELKYQLNPAFMNVLHQRLQSVMLRDPHSDADGSYTVTSLYFDNCFDKALKEKQYGLNRREKFRLRYYGRSTDRVMLEKKQKHSGLCLKSSALICSPVCRSIMNCDYLNLTQYDEPLVRELGIKMQTQLLRPKSAVRYRREAFVYGPGNVRVTLDTELLSCSEPELFFSEKTAGWMPVPGAVLEVKYDRYLPQIIEQLLGCDIPQLQSFSKYARCRAII
ncbi:MAG: polyphosphate polymerase domain-containing protein [Anaerovoracaceae bacterium]